MGNKIQAFVTNVLILYRLASGLFCSIIKENKITLPGGAIYMSSKPRQFEIGRIYHIIKRGVDGRKIFLKSQDYSRFILGLEFFNNENPIDLWNLIRGDGLNTAEGGRTSLREKIENQRKNKGKLIVGFMAFALMPSHFHLIVREIIDKGISYFMQKMGGYTGYFNKQYNRRGNLFESI